MTGRFVTFDGLDGAGKSTQVTAVANALRREGLAVMTTREPGGTRLGERLREILLVPDEAPIVPEAELLLLFAARAQHIETLIRPALERGTWVLCDRFTDASYAYQGGGRGVVSHRIAALESLVQGSLRPHLTLILDLPIAVGLARTTTPHFPDVRDRFERERHAFFERVRKAYLARCRSAPDRYVVIDAELGIEEVTRAILAEIRSKLLPLETPPDDSTRS